MVEIYFYQSSDSAHDYFGDSLLNLMSIQGKVSEQICRNAILPGLGALVASRPGRKRESRGVEGR